MKKILLSIGIALMLFSCATPLVLSEANQQFESETKTPIVLVLRGLYSIGSFYENDPAYSTMKTLIEEGKVTLVSSETTEYRAFVEEDTMGGYTISIQNFFTTYNEIATNMAYLTALLATVAKMEVVSSEAQDPELLKTRFFEVIEMYKNTYSTVSFEGDPWFDSNSMKVEGNYIY